MIVVGNDPKLKPWQRPTHRTHLATGVHQKTRRIDHTKPLDQPKFEALFKGPPGVCRAGCREDHPNGIVSIVRSLRLFEQDRDRKSVVEGKSLDLGGRRIIKKKSINIKL